MQNLIGSKVNGTVLVGNRSNQKAIKRDGVILDVIPKTKKSLKTFYLIDFGGGLKVYRKRSEFEILK